MGLANVSGGLESAFSLAELSAWCGQRFARQHPVERNGADRPFDIPWLILNDAQARQAWDWRPQITREAIFSQVADFAETEPAWLDLSAV